jgi:hypothetical protein
MLRERPLKVPFGKAPIVNDLDRLTDHSSLLPQDELVPWLEAASKFVLNTDFDISEELDGSPLPLSKLMKIMKDESAGKRTIQAIGDKILLNALIENIGVPQMPALYASHGDINESQVEQLVDDLESSLEDDAFDIVCKPTHLSNCTGTLLITTDYWEYQEYDADTLVDHMKEYMPEKAHETESAALQSLLPGFIIQPLYRSPYSSVPIEIRVFTLWGKTRVGVWWWGTGKEENAWIVQGSRGEWRALHDNPKSTDEYKRSLGLILQQMPQMARDAEKIAIAVGTPFLRSDFFVGSEKWGTRLNEVAYGSNIEMRRAAPGPSKSEDDSDAMAQILQEGYKHCRRQHPEMFLSRLGASGSSYETEWWKFWSKAPGLQVSPTRKAQHFRFPTAC